MKRRALDLTGRRFGRLTALYPLPERKHGNVVWRCKCNCGNTIDVPTEYLTKGDTTSCGCAKKGQDAINLREKYDEKRVEGIARQLFKGKKPRKDSSIGYRGVLKYYTRVRHELRYKAWITVAGKRRFKFGFKTPEEAYYQGRLELEKKYLPFDPPKEK